MATVGVHMQVEVSTLNIPPYSYNV